MTVVSGGDLIVNAPLDNTSSTTTLSSADNLIINENITEGSSLHIAKRNLFFNSLNYFPQFFVLSYPYGYPSALLSYA